MTIAIVYHAQSAYIFNESVSFRRLLDQNVVYESNIHRRALVMTRILILIIFAAGVLYSDDIYLKNGTIIKNVKIIKQGREWTVFQTPEGEQKIRTFLISKIVKSDYHSQQQTEIRSLRKAETAKTEAAKYPNLKLLPLSLMGIGLFIDSIFEIDEINDQISSLKQSRYSDPTWAYRTDQHINELKRKRTRKIMVSAAILTATVLNTVISLERLAVKPATNGIQLSLHF